MNWLAESQRRRPVLGQLGLLDEADGGNNN